MKNDVRKSHMDMMRLKKKVDELTKAMKGHTKCAADVKALQAALDKSQKELSACQAECNKLKAVITKLKSEG